MKPIAKLIAPGITPTPPKRLRPKETILSSPIPPGKRTARSSTYEVEVFNYLFENRHALGIQSVSRFRNILIDGEIVLTNGRRLLVEVKLRMNWLKACQAEWQVRQFLKRFDSERPRPVDGAIVFFEEFTGDWNRPRGTSKNVWGWDTWYLHYHDAVAGKPLDLLMLRDGVLSGYPG